MSNPPIGEYLPSKSPTTQYIAWPLVILPYVPTSTTVTEEFALILYFYTLRIEFIISTSLPV
nr:MAG: hypothetical protein [Bacteriophage sp.]